MTAAGEHHGAEAVRPPRAGRPRSLPRPWLVVGALLPFVLLGLLGAFLLTRGGPVGGSIGAQAPTLELQGLDGNPIRLADYRGRPLMVNFWASWCGPCVAEFPLLQRAAAEHEADGLALIGIVYRDNADAARSFMEGMGADWPTGLDPDEEAADAFGILAGPPETFFIDANGTVAARQIGQLSATDLQRHLDTILAKE